jgi:type IV pilus assembly protein PilN
MIRINLLPFRAARKKENIRRQISIFLLSLMLVTVAVVFFNFRLSNKIKNLNTMIADTKAQVEKYNKINQEIEDIKRKLEILNKKITVIETLEANRRDSITLLDSLTKLIMVDRMWFTLLKSKEDNIDVTGIALDNRTVADFMTRLEFSENYTNVNLKTIKQEAIPGKNINLKNFNITFTKAPLTKPDTKKAKDS